MTDENKSEVKQEAPKIDFAAKIAELESANVKMASHMEVLLGETKQAKEAKRQAEDSISNKVDAKIAEQNNDFEKLLAQSQGREAEALKRIHSFEQKGVEQNISNAAQALTNDLGPVSQSAEILKQLVRNELTKITDENGNVSETALQALKTQFKNDEAYKPLLVGNLSNGGGASGVKAVGSATDTLTHSQFDSMSNSERDSHYAKHGAFKFED